MFLGQLMQVANCVVVLKMDGRLYILTQKTIFQACNNNMPHGIFIKVMDILKKENSLERPSTCGSFFFTVFLISLDCDADGASKEHHAEQGTMRKDVVGQYWLFIFLKFKAVQIYKLFSTGKWIFHCFSRKRVIFLVLVYMYFKRFSYPLKTCVWSTNFSQKA